VRCVPSFWCVAWVWCVARVWCVAWVLGLLVSFVLSSAPLHFVFLALLVSQGSLSLSHAH
jgi:hypothetical protein